MSSPEVQEVPTEAAARQPTEVPMKRSTDEPARTHKKHKLLAPQRHSPIAGKVARGHLQKVELEEASRQQEVMVKELNDSRILLGDIQHKLKDVWTRSQVMEDDLLKSVRAVETLKSEMPP
ncbi:hypothetical protein GW17_00020058 [Ensete ventricosum]|nr:hypothetical protein GW17_00020058 [Ensete ventricosum]